MKRHDLLLLLACAGLITSCERMAGRTEPQNDPASAQTLIEVERDSFRRLIAGDKAVATQIIASNFIGYDSGFWSGKLQWIPYDRAAMLKDAEVTQGKAADVALDSLDAHVHGSFGVVRGHALWKNKDGSGFETHFLDTWERRSGTWVMVAAANFGEEKR